MFFNICLSPIIYDFIFCLFVWLLILWTSLNSFLFESTLDSIFQNNSKSTILAFSFSFQDLYLPLARRLSYLHKAYMLCNSILISSYIKFFELNNVILFQAILAYCSFQTQTTDLWTLREDECIQPRRALDQQSSLIRFSIESKLYYLFQACFIYEYINNQLRQRSQTKIFQKFIRTSTLIQI